MAKNNTKKPRMYDPWGYRDQDYYESSENQFEIELNELFASAKYDDTDKKIHFFNNDGDEISESSIDTTEFASGVIDDAYYDSATKELVIVFDNGTEVRINMAEIIDENEFGDGLQVDSSGIVSVKIDAASEPYLIVSSDGIKLSGIEALIEAEKQRATSAETALDEKIDAEIADRIADVDAEEARALSAETVLQAAIDAETARATSAETALDEKIDQETVDRIADVDAEEARALSAETVLQAAIDAEEQRAKDAEQVLDGRINTEIADRIADVDAEEARALSAETALQAAIDQEAADRAADVDEEEARAKEAEQALQNAIDAEKTRATQTEGQLNHRIDLVNDELGSEESRAQAAEQELRLLITTEIADRKADVDAEEARAISAETALNEKINQEINDRKAEAVSDVLYDSENKSIVFNNKNGETISTIDAKPFIKDGMIDSVELVELSGDTYLRITWNTDSGKEVTDINIGDIFDSEKYYTKDETDALIEEEKDRAISAETELNEKIESEESRAISAETELNDKIESEEARAISAETALDEKIESEEARAISAETELNDKIESEESRAISAETEILNTVGELASETVSAITELNEKIDAEIDRAISAETELNEKIEESSGTTSELINELIEKLGYTDNDTIERNNGGSEVAFGTYNISTQSDDPAQKTLFSIGNGTDDANRNNALEVKQNGDVYLWVEGEFMNVNRLLAQIAHEVYDSDAAANNPHYFDGD